MVRRAALLALALALASVCVLAACDTGGGSRRAAATRETPTAGNHPLAGVWQKASDGATEPMACQRDRPATVIFANRDAGYITYQRWIDDSPGMGGGGNTLSGFTGEGPWTVTFSERTGDVTLQYRRLTPDSFITENFAMAGSGGSGEPSEATDGLRRDMGVTDAQMDDARRRSVEQLRTRYEGQTYYRCEPLAGAPGTPVAAG